MQTVGALAAKTHFFTTKQDHADATLTSAKAMEQPHVKQAIKRLQDFSQSNILGDLDWKELRDEERK